MLKRANMGVYHKPSPKHLQRYVQEFAGRHNVRESDTIDLMAPVVAGMIGKLLCYRDLIAYNGLNSGARLLGQQEHLAHLDGGNCCITPKWWQYLPRQWRARYSGVPKTDCPPTTQAVKRFREVQLEMQV